MNLTALEKRLIETARANPPDDRVPYAFEKRIMAHLSGSAPMDVIGLWGRALWRAALPCIALSIMLGVWNFWDDRSTSLASSNLASSDFPKEFEAAVLIAADQSSETW